MTPVDFAPAGLSVFVMYKLKASVPAYMQRASFVFLPNVVWRLMLSS
jgi:hypothetical protein